MSNCWSTIFTVLPKIDGWQVDLANSWRCWVHHTIKERGFFESSLPLTTVQSSCRLTWAFCRLKSYSPSLITIRSRCRLIRAFHRPRSYIPRPLTCNLTQPIPCLDSLDHITTTTHRLGVLQSRLRMKTERKYPEPNCIVFCILSDRIRIFVSDFTVFAFVFVFQM
jgi:hypothetical protein